MMILHGQCDTEICRNLVHCRRLPTTVFHAVVGAAVGSSYAVKTRTTGASSAVANRHSDRT